MRVKVKWDGHSHPVDLGNRGINDVTLAELKQAVAQQFHAVEENFQLSLNKCDALQGDDQVLSEFGIVSGDLVHVIGANIPAAALDVRHRPQPLATYTPNSSEAFSTASEGGADSSNDNETAVSSSVSMSEGSTLTEDGSDMSLRPSDMDISEALDEEKEFIRAETGQAEINRFLQEPLVVRESTGSQVPISLSQLYKSSESTTFTDALWVTIHCLMLESGFNTQKSSPDGASMPGDWKKPGYYRCEYLYPVTPDISCACSVTGVTLGSTVAVHGTAQTEAGFNTETLHLTSSHFVRGLTEDVPAVFRALDKLSLIIKDKICLPLINELSTGAGYGEKQGLLAMPWEVWLRIMSFLNARSLSRLGETCQELGSLHRDKVIWRRLHLIHFGKPADSSLGQDWYQLYKDNFIHQKRREEEMRRHRQTMSQMWPHRGMNFLQAQQPQSVSFPRVIGGDYDLHPHFPGAGFQPGFRRSTQSMGGPINRALPDGMDPLAAHLGRNMMPRQGGNLTGSPFSRNNRSGFF